jgi:MFS family permease
MQRDQVCPFYRRGEPFCDVGCGYISPHDVRMMVAFCNCRYGDCSKFQELSARFPSELGLPFDDACLPRLPAAERPRGDRGGAPGKPLVPHFKARWPLAFQLRCVTASYTDNPIPIKEVTQMKEQSSLKGWSVVMAGTGINLALGILYAYSMLKGDIAKLLGNQAGDPYAFSCLAFAVSMILGGKAQDKIGPRITAIIGGLLVGAGFIVCSLSSGYWGWVVGFGILAGSGFGFGYSAATPPALKWFPPAKTGLIAGIVVSGFGIAPVYLAPTCKYLLGSYGLQSTMMILGVAFIVIVCGMAMLVANPPAGFIPAAAATVAAKKSTVADKTPGEVLRDGRLYTLWLAFFVGAGAGLMVIGSIAGLAKESMGEFAFVAVAVMAIGNAGGRIVAGIVSDKIGRANTLMILLAFQALLMFAAIPVVGAKLGGAMLLVLLATLIGFNYGSNLSLFPSFAKDFWGAKNYGMNYGILFSAWGIGAFVLVKVSAALVTKFQSNTPSFAVAGGMLLIGAMLAMSLRPAKAKVAVEAPATVPVGYDEEELVPQKVK